jgi:Anti-sigma-K factor rskA
MTHTIKIDRALALACDRALFGLDSDREVELVALLPPGAHIDPGLELAAAAIALSELTIDEPLPRHLAERAFAAATGTQAPMMGLSGTLAMPTPVRAGLPPKTMLLPQSEPPQSAALRAEGTSWSSPDSVHSVDSVHSASQGVDPRLAEVVPIAKARRSNVVPWLAAAACFGLAAGSLTYAGFRIGEPTTAPVASVSAAVEKPSPAEARTRLLAEATDVVRTAWGATGDDAGKGETGEVIWSNARQEGYMTFRTVATNDPKTSQYQLWIFDGERDERYPVDGGVFDVDTSKGEVTIPISAKVAVAKPTLFAVTVEKPGGVVVSKRERIVVLAKTAS